MGFYTITRKIIPAIALIAVVFSHLEAAPPLNEMDSLLLSLEKNTKDDKTPNLSKIDASMITNSHQQDEIDLLLEKILSNQTNAEKKQTKYDTVIQIGAPSKKERASIRKNEGTNENTYFSNLIMRQEQPRKRNEIFLWPTPSMRVSSGYGYRTDPFNVRRREFHNGLDISGKTGDEIKASKSGTVTYAGLQRDYGYLVILKHTDDYYTLYAHNSVIKVRKGEYVSQGQIIARMGSTGRSTGPHLHFEIRKNKSRINPEAFFRTLLTKRY